MPRHSIRTALTLIAAVTCLQAGPAASQDADRLTELRKAALARTNASRQDAGLGSLSRSKVLDDAAQGHAEDMLRRDYFNHVSPDGTEPFDRFLDAGGSRWSVSGENIATCTGCAVSPDIARVDAFHEGWMDSPGHRKNILTEGFDSFGFGVASKNDTVYAVQTFSGPGDDGDAGDALAGTEIPGTALRLVNDRRAKAGLEPLARDAGLDQAAQGILQQGTETLPDDIFRFLPEGSTGWTSLQVQMAAAGGSGTTVTGEDLSTVIADWSDAADAESILGGGTATHLGFAAEADNNGRLSVVALFGAK